MRDEILPSWFVNRLQDKVAPFTNLRLRLASGTSIDVPAGAGDAACVVNIAGNWRFVEADVPPKAHPGGAAGVYTIFVTAKAQHVVNMPNPNTDLTDYSFGLAIVPDGSTPTIVAGTVDIFRAVGVLSWSGTKITSLRALVGVEAGFVEGWLDFTPPPLAAGEFVPVFVPSSGSYLGATASVGFSRVLPGTFGLILVALSLNNVTQVTLHNLSGVAFAGGPAGVLHVVVRLGL